MSIELDVRVALALGWTPRTVNKKYLRQDELEFIVYDLPGGNHSMMPGVSFQLSKRIDMAMTYLVNPFVTGEKPKFSFMLTYGLNQMPDRWWAAYSPTDDNRPPGTMPFKLYQGSAKNPAEAICLAFLELHTGVTGLI